MQAVFSECRKYTILINTLYNVIGVDFICAGVFKEKNGQFQRYLIYTGKSFTDSI